MKSHPEYCLKMHRRSVLKGTDDVLTGQKMCQHKQSLHKVGLCAAAVEALEFGGTILDFVLDFEAEFTEVQNDMKGKEKQSCGAFTSGG